MDFAGMDMSPDYTSTKLTESKMEYLKYGKLESSSELVLELTEYDIEREFARADAKLKNAGKRYTRDYFEEADMTDLMIDVILFTQSEDCMSELDKNTTVIVTTKSKHHDVIKQALEEKGFFNICFYQSE
jgi:homoserine acetyltransferase